MNNMHKKIILFFLVTLYCPMLPSQSGNNITSNKNFTPALIVGSFFLGYFIRYISFKKTYSIHKKTNHLMLYSQPTTTAQNSDSTIEMEKINTMALQIEQIEKELNQTEKDKTQIAQENEELKKTNTQLTNKINGFKECINKLFPSTLKKGDYAAVRFKTNAMNTSTVEDNKNSAEPIAIEFLEVFELNDNFKPDYNSPAKSWLFMRI